MRYLILLYGIMLSSCAHISSDNDDIPADTVYVVETVRDTVYINTTPAKTKADIYMDTLTSYLGTKEATGNNDGEIVERFTREACDMGRVAWCAAYLAYGLKVNDVDIPKCVCWSPCMVPEGKVVWRRGDKHKLNKGEIFGLYFKSKGRVAHVGAVVKDLGDGWVLTIEGNTNSAGAREGNGVYKRLRHRSQLYVAAKWI